MHASDNKEPIELKDDESEADADVSDNMTLSDAKDVSSDSTSVENATDASQQVQSETASQINVEVNLTTGADGQLHVSGPNPAEAAAENPAAAVHQAAANMHQQNSETPATVEPQEVTAVEGGVPEAHVSDSMSFAQAFAAARAEVGPGGCFTWHGQVYGTYYQNEWSQMSPQQQHDFQMAAINGSHYDPAAAPAHTNDYATAKASDYDAAHHDANNTSEAQHAGHDDDIVYVDPEPVADDEVRILGLGQVEDPDGNVHDAAILDFSGNQAMVVDTDSDQIYDVIAADLNGDGQISDDEIDSSFAQHNLSVQDVSDEYYHQQMADAQFDNDMDQNIPDNGDDFDNGTDVSSFV